jgi:phosphate/sulfate permease
VSTTQVVSGGILGSGIGKRLAAVHWGIAGRMVIAWVLTLPAAALVGAGVWKAADAVGGETGAVLMGIVAALERARRGSAMTANALVVALAAAVCLAALVAGFLAMTDK